MAANLKLVATVAKLDLHEKEKDFHANANALLDRILEKVCAAQEPGESVDPGEVNGC